jgi:pilus assembly protein CpaE
MENAIRAVVVGDDPTLANQVQSLLQCSGFDCRRDRDFMSLQAIADGASSETRQELVLVIMPSELNRGRKAVRDIRATSSASIIAIGPTNDSKVLLSILREGADEYVDVSDLESELESTLGRLQARRGRTLHRGRVVSVIGACGGSGTSSVACNLAALLAKKHTSSALIDLRLGLGDQSLLLDLEPKHTLAALCRNASRLDYSMFQRSLEQHSSGIRLLAAPSGWDECPDVTTQGVRQVVRLSRSQFPYVVIDLDNSFTAEQVAAIVSSDVILLVLRPDMLSLKNARRLLDTFERLGVAEDRVKIVANRYGQRGQLSIGRVEHAIGAKVIQCIPEDARGMNLAANKGVPIVIERSRSRISKRFGQLATALENLPGIYDDARTDLLPLTNNIEGSHANHLESHPNGTAIGLDAKTNGKYRSETPENSRYKDELDQSSIKLRL